MTNRKKILTLAIAVVVIILLCLLLYTYVSKTPAASTIVTRYTPSVSDLPSAVESGSCFSTSIAAPYRSDAWRCTVGNEIADPCFQVPDSQELLCRPDPISTTSPSTFALELTKSLPKPLVPNVNPPANWAWLVELSDGTICTPFTGTLPFSAQGDVAYYSCSSTVPDESMIFNRLDSSTTPWTAKVGILSTSSNKYPPDLSSYSTTTIKAIWQ